MNQAIKILERTNKEGILPLKDENFELFLGRHPKASKAPNKILLDEEVQDLYPVIHTPCNSDMVREAIKKTQGSEHLSLEILAHR